MHRLRCISPILLEEGVPILACGWTVGWRSVTYHFWVTVTLRSYLLSRKKRVLSISHTMWVRNLKFGVWMHPGMTECHVSGLGLCDLNLDFISIVVMSVVYLLYYLRFWFDLILYLPSTVIMGRVLLGWTKTKLCLMCLAQRHNAVTPTRLKPVAP